MVVLRLVSCWGESKVVGRVVLGLALRLGGSTLHYLPKIATLTHQIR